MKLVKILAITTALGASGSALAGTETWDFDDMSDSGWKNDVSEFSIEGVSDVRITGWADSGNNGVLEQGKVKRTGNGIYVKNNDESSTSSPHHAADSFGNEYESVLFEFSSAVSLQEIDFGWTVEGSCEGNGSCYGRADISILKYTGAGNASSSLTGSTWGNITNNGWSVVGHFGDVTTSGIDLTNYSAFDGASTGWMVMAYNGSLAGTHYTSGAYGGNDAFKINMLQASVKPDGKTPIPEPAAWALMLGGMLMLRRQVKK